MSFVLGIDLGTTNSVVAVADGGHIRVLSDLEGRRLIPSVVSFHPDGEVLVGREARERRLIDASNTIYSVKRLIGRPFKSEQVKKAQERFAFELTTSKSGGVVVDVRGETFTLTEISAFVLREVKRVAETQLDEECTSAVITVPANFNELQRSATKAAGRVAGLDVKRIINEPTAAALAYGHGRHQAERVAIYDLGGGTFDITILELENDIFQVVSTAGDTFLGGDDIDLLLAEEMATAFLKEHKWDAREDQQAFERIRAAAEWLKCKLSVESLVEVRIEALTYGRGGKPLDLVYRMHQDALTDVAGPLVDRSFDVTERAMQEANLKPKDIGAVILVGGSTRLPLVRQRVRDYFGREPLVDIDPDLVVAQGAAAHGHAISGQTEVKRSLGKIVLKRMSLQEIRSKSKRIDPRAEPPRPNQPAFAPVEQEAIVAPDPPVRPPKASAPPPPLPNLPASPKLSRPNLPPPPPLRSSARNVGAQTTVGMPAIAPPKPTVGAAALNAPKNPPVLPSRELPFSTMREPVQPPVPDSQKIPPPKVDSLTRDSLAAPKPFELAVPADPPTSESARQPMLHRPAEARPPERLSLPFQETPSARAEPPKQRKVVVKELKAIVLGDLQPGEPRLDERQLGERQLGEPLPDRPNRDEPTLEDSKNTESQSAPATTVNDPTRFDAERTLETGNPDPLTSQLDELGVEDKEVSTSVFAITDSQEEAVFGMSLDGHEDLEELHADVLESLTPDLETVHAEEPMAASPIHEPEPIADDAALGPALDPAMLFSELEAEPASTLSLSHQMMHEEGRDAAPTSAGVAAGIDSVLADLDWDGAGSGADKEPAFQQNKDRHAAPHSDPQRASTAPQAAQPMLVMPESPPPLLMDVTPHSLCIETVGGYCQQIIRRNAPVPAEQSRTFSTAKDDQQNVRARICQGESKVFEDNQVLGEIELNELRAMPRGHLKIDVSFILDADGTLGVQAIERETGQQQHIQIRLLGGSTEEELEAMAARRRALVG
ncbi:MAG: Hsp70 family protein [Myxococcota bacterium]